jgi:L-arginine dehydrogenase
MFPANLLTFILGFMASSSVDGIQVVSDGDGRLAVREVLGALRAAFAALGDGNGVQPPQSLTELPAAADGSGYPGDVIVYQALLPELYGVKVSPYLPPGATGQDDAIVSAWTLLLSTRTGRPLLLCDSKWLTTERTAATSALAVDLLARPDVRTLAVIGAGPVAQAHFRYATAIRDFTDVRAYSPGLASGQREPLAGAAISASAEEAADGADVVLLCTSSATPVLDLAAVRTGAVVTAVSTNAPRAHEIEPSELAGLEVYADYRPTVTAVAGDMVIAIEQGLWSADQLRGDLPELVSQKAPLPSHERVAYFRSVGLGIEDVAIARLLLQP